MSGGARPRRRGTRAEALAEAYLVREGYCPLARNHHALGGEVDLIVGRDGAIVFVEVKMRRPGSVISPIESVTRSKQRRVVQAAFDYVQRHRLEDRDMRFDVVAVTSGGARSRQPPVIEHIEAAFDTMVLDDS